MAEAPKTAGPANAPVSAPPTPQSAPPPNQQLQGAPPPGQAAPVALPMPPGSPAPHATAPVYPNTPNPALPQRQGHVLTRAGMEQVLRQGGSVAHNGALITDPAQLPSDAELAGPFRRQLGEQTRANMERIVRDGGRVVFQNRTITRVQDLPSPVELAGYDDRAMQDEMDRLNAEQRRLDHEKATLEEARNRSRRP